MKPPRVIAAFIVDAVLKGYSLTASLQKLLTNAKPGDKPLIQSLSYGVFRYYPQLGFVIDAQLKKPLKASDQLIFSLLLVGCYELLYQKTADHVVINETVNAAKVVKKNWACSLINAILRHIQRQSDLVETLFQKTQAQALKTLHPDWLVALLCEQWGNLTDAVIEANNTQAPMVLRVNPLKITREAYLVLLHQHQIDAIIQPFTEMGIVLKKPENVADLPGFFDGLVSVQDGAAQLAAPFLTLCETDHVLDVCCAPGGKLTHIVELMPRIARLVGWDQSADRMALVRDNLARLSLDQLNTIELNVGDAVELAERYQGNLFDKILLDAPCSGSGVIRRHPDSKYLRRKTDVTDTLPAAQTRLLEAIWPLLKPGGRLVYSTCSIFANENEAVIQGFLANYADACHIPVTGEGLLIKPCGAYILPGDANRDGFYYSMIEKAG